MADQLLETAVANWEPRFTVNGVEANDYARITKPLTAWGQWCQAWCDGAEEYLALAEIAKADGHAISAGEHFARAATYFHFGKFLFVHDMEQMRAAHTRAVSALTNALPFFVPPASRIEIPYGGAKIVGVLRRPNATERKWPTVILIPGLDSTKEEFRDVEKAFHNRGMATFAMDGPGQGEAEYDLRITPKWDEVGTAVLAKLLSLPDVDGERIGVWGVSLGGFYAARLAASDLPIVATIALAGPYNLGETWDRLNPLTQSAFMVRSHSHSIEEAKEKAFELTLEGHAQKIKKPLLVIMGKLDRLFPYTEAERLIAETTGPTKLILLERGNHGCANVIQEHRPYCADWMADQLSGEG
jgi:2,6-dihydroxypseudooxynicotine hydrolase